MLSYNSNAIVPAPFVTVNKSYISAPDTRKIGVEYAFTINGTLLPNKGSPNSDGEFATTGDLAAENFTTDTTKWRSILRKQQAIRRLFSEDGHTLEWQPPGYSSVTCYPHVVNVTFPEGQWVEKCAYSVQCTANRLFGPSGVNSAEDALDLGIFYDYNLKSASDKWDIKETNDGSNITELTRTVTATAGKIFTGDNLGTGVADDDEAWELAKAWVEYQLAPGGDDTIGSTAETFMQNKSIFAYNFDGLSPWDAYTRVRTENIDRLAGSYTIVENWQLSQSGAIDIYTVRQESSVGNVPEGILDSTQGTGLSNIFTISGNIRGLRGVGAGPNEYVNALSHFTNTVLAQSGGIPELIRRINHAIHGTRDNSLSLVKQPATSVITRNIHTGVIQYDYSFSDTGGTGLDGIRQYSITVSQDGGDENAVLTPTVLAVIPIPGRSGGPIIQNMGTRPTITRTINCNMVLDTLTILGGLSWDMYDHNDGSPYTLDVSYLRASLDTIMDNEQVKPDTSKYEASWITAFSDNLDVTNMTYSATVTYTIKVD